MPHRLDVELTSERADGTFTWRKAGAREPKGVVDAKVLYEGAKVGDVMRAEAEMEVDGITILSVVPPRQKKPGPETIQLLGPPRADVGGVTTSLQPRSPGRRPRPGEGRGEPGGRTDRPDRAGRRPRQERPEGERTARRGEPRAPREDGTDRQRRPGTTEGERRPPRPGPEGRPPRPGAGEGRRPDQRRGAAPGRGPEGGRRPPSRAEGEESSERQAPKRLVPKTTHRDAVLASLSPEQRPVAEQVLRGGIPAVRQALAAETDKAKAEGRPEIDPAPLLAMAEEILPLVRAAAWRDRAEAAAAMVDEIGLRDLRSVVTGADQAARDDETRLLARSLREALERRVEERRQSWVGEIESNLEGNRVVRALRLSGRPPDPGIRFPAELAVKLAEAASAAMAPDVPPDRWAVLLEAVAASPVRRNVRPAGLPAEPGEDLLRAARQTAGLVPALAGLLGLSMPPPPGPARAIPPRPPARRGAPRPPGSHAAPPPPGGRPAPATPPPGEQVSAGATTEEEPGTGAAETGAAITGEQDTAVAVPVEPAPAPPAAADLAAPVESAPTPSVADYEPAPDDPPPAPPAAADLAAPVEPVPAEVDPTQAGPDPSRPE